MTRHTSISLEHSELYLWLLNYEANHLYLILCMPRGYNLGHGSKA